MANTYVTPNNLICLLDASNLESYPGTGTVCYDISGSRNHFNIIGNITWDATTGFSNFGGNSTGSGNKLQAQVASSFTSLKTANGGQGYTICIWARSTGGGGAWRKLIGNSDADNYIDLYQSSAASGLWHQDGSGEYLYVNDASYVANDTFSMLDSVWRMYSASNINNGTTTTPGGTLSIGNEPTSNSYPWVGNIGVVMIYNRRLQPQEIVNNYYAYKTRYSSTALTSTPAEGMLTAERVQGNSGETGLIARSGVDKKSLYLCAGDTPMDVRGFITPTNKTRTTFSYNGSDQSWTVPVNTFYVWAKLWGSGGGGGCAGGWTHGGEGGGGGFTRGLIPVTPGESLTIKVPRGGSNNPGTTNAYPGGGSSTAGGDNQYAAGGGGYAGIFRGSSPLLIAGGGGGGGSFIGNWNTWNHGGAGGGAIGQHGWCNIYTYAGTGGAQGSGGTGGNGNNTGGGNGSSLQGGSLQGNPYGGGGGGGYYGGGSGSYGTGNTMAGGGGGSGYVDGTVLLGMTAGGSRQHPAFTADPDFPHTGSTYTIHGYGGMTCSSGGDGYIVIYY